jgi:hypothetical protein
VEAGAELIRWTVRLAFAAYAGRLALDLAWRAGGERKDRTARWLWTAGCMLLWAHVISAFEFVHHWSHDDAYNRTAIETAEKVGLAWGGGIYFNYLFMLLWAGDVVWWWWQPASYAVRSRFVAVPLHAYLAFILFNATVVFKEGWLRYAGLAVTIGLGIAAVRVLTMQSGRGR